MAKKSFLHVALKKKDNLYKINTISLSNDDSIYIFNNFNAEKKIHHKFSYHPTGQGHFTEGQDAKKQYVFPKKRPPKSDISDPIGLMHITLQGIHKKDFDGLRKLTNLSKYNRVIYLNADKYHNLTIKYWLASSNFDTSRSSHIYEEVFEEPIDENYKLLIATISTKDTSELLGFLI